MLPSESDPVERARLAVARAHARRRALPVQNIAASLDDPHGRGRSAYRSAVRELGELVPRLVDGLFRQARAADRGR